MGNSTIQLQDVFAYTKAKGIPIPTEQPGGYGTRLALKIGNDILSAIVAERFNPKWNREVAQPFLTNSYQQDYPQKGLVNIGWLEEADRVDINNTAIPKPTNVPGVTVVRDLSRTSQCLWPPNQLCWKYNQNLVYGANAATLANPSSWGAPSWPGAHVTFNPQITTGPVLQNPIMSMIDANGNLLIVSNLGSTPIVTGSTAPAAAANSPEGTTVTDGSVIWVVVAAMSQGFRIFPLPSGTGPVYQFTPYYQMILEKLTALTSLINPIPDDQNYIYQEGIDIACKRASSNPTLRAEGMKDYPLWIAALTKLLKQNDRETDAYTAFAADQPVESVYSPYRGIRNPQDPSQPY